MRTPRMNPQSWHPKRPPVLLLSVLFFSFVLRLVCLVCFTSLSLDCHANGYDAHRGEAKEKKPTPPKLALGQPNAGDLSQAVFQVMVRPLPDAFLVSPHADRGQVRLAVQEWFVGEHGAALRLLRKLK